MGPWVGRPGHRFLGCPPPPPLGGMADATLKG
jgi:hypothetical protein